VRKAPSPVRRVSRAPSRISLVKKLMMLGLAGSAAYQGSTVKFRPVHAPGPHIVDTYNAPKLRMHNAPGMYGYGTPVNYRR
jgi:hypothetical protein